MKKLIAVLIMLIFIIPFSVNETEAGKKDKRYKKNSREYHKYENRGRHRGHDHSRYYNKYRRHERKRVYKYKGHYRDRHEWNKHHRRNDREYRSGEYHYDKNDRLMFSYCLENEEGTRRSSERQEMCFSFSIGD